MRVRNNSLARTILLGLTATLGVVGLVLAASPNVDHVISQKNRRFQPNVVALRPGERITILNDDADLTHHAFIDAPDLAYDSGDQEPGTKAVITFPTAGDFTVLCAIHPKMTLAVRVR